MWGNTFSAQMKTLSPVNTDCHLNSIITFASYPLPIIAFFYGNKEALRRRTHSPSSPHWGTADPETFSAKMKTLSPVNTDCHLNSIITVASYLLPIIAVCMLIRRHYEGTHIHPVVRTGALRTLRPRSGHYIKVPTASMEERRWLYIVCTITSNTLISCKYTTCTRITTNENTSI